MSLTPEQIAELQAEANKAKELQQQLDAATAKKDELEQRLNAVDAKKNEILDEKKNTTKEKDELAALVSQLKGQLDDLGQKLTESEKERQEAETKRQEAEKERITTRLKADFVSVFNSGEVHNPEHAWTMLNSFVADEKGGTVALVGGTQTTVSGLRDKLRQDPQFAYLFKPVREHGGMGSRPPASGEVSMSSNPYAPGGSLTARIALEIDNPDLAAKLEAEAEKASRQG
jgi:small-conductance mechanosensitive channel